ncbi:uncharacterized protein BDW70DRAFT_148404 [Aspergillus foveolatus]|uniref:uncharacterized protein n=1 Tax=Aspergillus foveolatus TaxID=210207 RepID=UPI003CCCFA20
MHKSKDSLNSTSSRISKSQLFPLAHPPPKSKSASNKSPRLRLSTRLLLQIQQSSQSRAIPILELYQPSTFGKSIALPDGSRKVHGRDLYVTQSEMYTHLKRPSKRDAVDGYGIGYGHGYGNRHGHTTKPRSGSGGSRSVSGSASGSATSSRPKSRSSGGSSGDEGQGECKAKFRARRKSGNDADGEQDDVVAMIHTSPKSTAADAQLFFPQTNQTWETTSSRPGYYRFRSDGSSIVFEWEKRPPSRSHPSSAAENDDGERFVLGVSVSEPTSSHTKRPWLAQLSKRGVHVGGLEAWRDEPGLRALIDGVGDGAGAGASGAGAGLYTLILTMGVWVAKGEGWVN